MAERQPASGPVQIKSFVEYGDLTPKDDCQWARLFIQDQEARGKTHPAAVRALAFKWQRILFVCWRDRTPYDEDHYLKALKSRGSHLAAKLETLSRQAA